MPKAFLAANADPITQFVGNEECQQIEVDELALEKLTETGIYDLIDRVGRIPEGDLLDYEIEQQELGLAAALIAVSRQKAAEAYSRYVQLAERTLPFTSHTERKIEQKLCGSRIMVIGGTGIVGTALTGQLIGLGKESGSGPKEVVVVSRGQHQAYKRHTAKRTEEDMRLDRNKLTYKECDITDAEALEALMMEHKPDIVFHVAAQRYPDIAEQQVALTVRTNVDGTRNVVEAARKAGVKQIVYTSTGKNEQPYPGGVQEDGTLQTNVYHATKAITEAYLSKEAAKGDMLITGIRFTHVVDDSNILVKMHEWIANRRRFSAHDLRFNFYGQSGLESVRLCLIGAVGARRGKFKMFQLRDLGAEFELGNLMSGAMIDHQMVLPLHGEHNPAGYKTGSIHPPLIDRKPPGTVRTIYGKSVYKGDVSPLVSVLDLDTVRPAPDCPDHVDEFSVIPHESTALDKAIDRLADATRDGACEEEVRRLLQECSILCVDARVATASPEIQSRIVGAPDANLTGIVGALPEGTSEVLEDALSRQYARRSSSVSSVALSGTVRGVDLEGGPRATYRLLGEGAIRAALESAAEVIGLLSRSGSAPLQQGGALAGMRK